MTNKKKIVLIVAILSMIVISFMGGQSFSKYISQVKGYGQFDIAKWSFLVNGQESSMNTIDLSSTCNNGTLINNKIAPGTEGNFNIEIDATGSEVGIQYQVTFDEKSQKPNNLYFIYNKSTYANFDDLAYALKGVINADAENKKISIPIKWIWEYETGNSPELREPEDVEDTQDGKTLQNYAFDVIVTGTQVEPNA